VYNVQCSYNIASKCQILEILSLSLKQDKEAANGAHAPRIISLDDYFLTEVEKQEKDPETGKRVKKKVKQIIL
jgi:hypothetical protein